MSQPPIVHRRRDLRISGRRNDDDPDRDDFEVEVIDDDVDWRDEP